MCVCLCVHACGCAFVCACIECVHGYVCVCMYGWVCMGVCMCICDVCPAAFTTITDTNMDEVIFFEQKTQKRPPC